MDWVDIGLGVWRKYFLRSVNIRGTVWVLEPLTSREHARGLKMTDKNVPAFEDDKPARLAFNPEVDPPNCDPNHMEYGIYVECHPETRAIDGFYRATWTGMLPEGVKERPSGAWAIRDEAVRRCRVRMLVAGILDCDGKMLTDYLSPARSGAV